MRSLVAILSLFAFIALVFEPLYYFGCAWKIENCPKSPYPVVQYAGQIWEIYIQWDPLFAAPPLWLRVMCALEVVAFGPLYAACAYGLACQTAPPWLEAVALPFAGALFYSTVVYFALEAVEAPEGTNFYMVFLVNIPWSIVPVLLAVAARGKAAAARAVVAKAKQG